MGPFVIKSIKATLFIGVVIICGLIIWSITPNKAAPFPPDPAVAYANKAFGNAQPYSEGYFEHEGQKLHYVEVGEGPLVVLVHGFPAYWYAMIRQMEALRPNYRVVAIDSLGAGLSDAPKDISKYKLKTRTAHMKALAQHLAPNEKLHIIGHDWGSAFSFTFAQNHPDTVLSVTGISSPPHNVFLNLLENNTQQQATSEYVEKLKSANPVILKALNASDRIWAGAYKPLLEGNNITEEESDLFRNNFRNPKRTNAYLNWYRANIPPYAQITDSDYWPAKNTKLKMPILIIRGLEDKTFVAEYTKLTAALSQNPSILELENVGHWPHMEASATVNATIRQFLKEHDEK